MKKTLTVLCCAMVLAFAFAFVGCSSGGSSNDSSKEQATEATEQAAEESTESAEAPATDYNLIFVSQAIDNVYWDQTIRGTEDAGEEFGATTKVLGDPVLDNCHESVPKFFKEALEEKPDGILTWAGTEGMTELIDEAEAAGIPVVTIGADAADSKREAFAGSDKQNLGVQLGRKLAEITDGKAVIGYVPTDLTLENEKMIYSGIKDAIADYDMEVVAEEPGQCTLEDSKKATEKMLKEHPEITAIVCTGGWNVTGAAAALEEAGLAKDIVLVGQDDLDENLQYVRDDVIDALIAQTPYQMGYQGVKAMVSILNGEKLANDFIETPGTLITKDNVDTYKD